MPTVTPLQDAIIEFCASWVKTENTPVPRKQVIAYMETRGVSDDTASWALQTLVKKGFLRRSVIVTNTTSYVLLRRI